MFGKKTDMKEIFLLQRHIVENWLKSFKIQQKVPLLFRLNLFTIKNLDTTININSTYVQALIFPLFNRIITLTKSTANVERS